uniref:RRM domain-containing protein n=1 Tax=Parascaris equorum TaxID=6256 RepID=A0A914RHU7_PAREQ
LPADIRETELRRVFEKYGRVEDVDIKTPPETNAAYAFILFQVRFIMQNNSITFIFALSLVHNDKGWQQRFYEMGDAHACGGVVLNSQKKTLRRSL